METEENKSITKINLWLDSKGDFNPALLASSIISANAIVTDRNSDELYLYNPDTGIYEKGDSRLRTIIEACLHEENREHRAKETIYLVHSKTLHELNPSTKLAIENGLLEPATKTLDPFTDQEFCTTKLAVRYDPELQCPRILKFLTEVVGPEQLDIMQEVFGYCLLRGIPFHKAVMLIGEGANGKSTLLGLMTTFLGKENVSSASLQAICYNRFIIAQLHGKLANICADLPSQILAQTGAFKMLTGGDTLNAEEKFKQPFSFKNTAKLIFSANKVPETLDDTVAYFRRWILIVCNNVFIGAKCNAHILEEITTPDELSGLLNWSLTGLERLLENSTFSENKTVEELRTQYIRKSNSAKAYVEENLVYDPSEKAYIAEIELYEKYILFCQTNKLPSMPKARFTQNIHQFLPQTKQTNERILGKVTHVWKFIRIVEFVATVATPLINTITDDNPILNKKTPVATVATVTNTEAEQLTGNYLLKVCVFCGKPIKDNIWDLIGQGDESGRPAHLACADSWRMQRKKEAPSHL